MNYELNPPSLELWRTRRHERAQAGPSVARTLWRAGCLFNSKAEGRGRDARATTEVRLRQGFLLRKDASADETARLGGASNMPFCETNPFCFRTTTDASLVFTVAYDVCRRFCKWGRSGKRTHLRGHITRSKSLTGVFSVVLSPTPKLWRTIHPRKTAAGFAFDGSVCMTYDVRGIPSGGRRATSQLMEAA